MYINAYTLSYGNWTVIPSQWEISFKEMKDCGFNSVSLSFSESEFTYARRTIELQVKMAHEHGLEVWLVPSRLGGRVAGAPFMQSNWLLKNPDAAEPDFPTLGCFASEKFQNWFYSFMENLLNDYPVEGVIWDEPKGITYISSHKDTLDRLGHAPDTNDMAALAVDFWEKAFKLVKKCNPNIKNILFANKCVPGNFIERIIDSPVLDYFGYDGTLSKQSFFHEEAFDNKYSIFDVYDDSYELCQRKGKGSFALLENMLIPASAHDEYKKNLEKFLKKDNMPDILSIYFYGHNNENPEDIHRITKELMKKYLTNSTG